MIDEYALKNEIRLAVIESFVSTLFAKYCVEVNPSNPLAALEKAEKKIISDAQKWTFSNFAAVESDMISAELEIAFARVLGMVRGQITTTLNALRDAS